MWIYINLTWVKYRPIASASRIYRTIDPFTHSRAFLKAEAGLTRSDALKTQSTKLTPVITH